MAHAKTTVITVRTYKDSMGYWCAESDDLFGLNLWKRTKRDLENAIPSAIKRLYEANGLSVANVQRADSPSVARPTLSPVRPRTTAYILEDEPLTAAL